ncbi:MAG: tautomerase family protein [Clostridia bacterium]|nr:tautomerase family protein [Clostridia bacterium]
MPHIEIKCYPGRSEEVKKALADKIAVDVVEMLGVGEKSVSIAITEVDKENWKKDVWDVSIAPDMDKLYVKPDYKC